MQREVRTVSATTAVSSPSREKEDRAEKYLTFRMGPDTFSVPFVRVREIMGIQEIKVVPQPPVFLKGVINLRGKIVPVVDLRLKFGLPEREYKPRTCIIVVQIDNPTAGKLTMGIVVDSVAEVLTLRPSDIQNGVVRVKGKIKTLLNLDVLFSTEEMRGLVAACF
jgi:purine-binding chemotaxis protein CheW